MLNPRQLLLAMLVILPLGAFALSHTTPASGAAATHIVISEVQIAGDTAADEFIEIYNPTEDALSLDGWRLKRETSSGTASATTIIASVAGTIQPHGYFLFASSGYTGHIIPDQLYSSSNTVASNNTILLLTPSNLLIDKLGLGTASDSETAPEVNPPAHESVERKANSDATIDSMISGGDAFLGNAEDTDNNAEDFILRTSPNPQNSIAAVEPQEMPTDTISPTPTMTPSLTAFPSVTPSESPIPSSTPSPTETQASSETTVTPVVSIIPSISPSHFRGFPLYHILCTTKLVPFQLFSFTMQFPTISCRFIQ